jgi:hypothetical protein
VVMRVARQEEEDDRKGRRDARAASEEGAPKAQDDGAEREDPKEAREAIEGRVGKAEAGVEDALDEAVDDVVVRLAVKAEGRGRMARVDAQVVPLVPNQVARNARAPRVGDDDREDEQRRALDGLKGRRSELRIRVRARRRRGGFVWVRVVHGARRKGGSPRRRS